MRVLFCKIHCPSFICFCKPTSHIYTPVPLKLENSPHAPSTKTTTAVSSLNDNGHQLVCGLDDDEETSQVKEESVVEEGEGEGEGEGESENCTRSSLKKAVSDSKQAQPKKKVQWMDFLGKELVEIREFEASEGEDIEDIDNDSEFNKGCVCTIL